MRRRGTKFAVVVDIGRDEMTSQRKQKWYSGFKTKKEAEKKLTEVLGKLDAGSYTHPSKETVGGFLTEWLASIRPPVVSQSTWASHRTFVECHLKPSLGDVPLQQLSGAHLNALYSAMLDHGRRDGKGGLSARTVHAAHDTIHLALNAAVRWQLVPRNVAQQASPPPPGRPNERPTWTVDELNQFINHIAGDRLFAAYVLAAYSGLRRGELLGLRWRDLDFEHGTLAVVQTVISVDYKVLFSRPKTTAGRRSIALDPGTMELLKAHRLQQVEERAYFGLNDPTADDLVFASIDGAPLHPDGFSDRFTRLVSSAGVRRITVHGMRHTHATLLLIAGIHPRVVQERLGHNHVSITLQTYSHVGPGLQEEAAGKFAALFEGP